MQKLIASQFGGAYHMQHIFQRTTYFLMATFKASQIYNSVKIYNSERDEFKWIILRRAKVSSFKLISRNCRIYEMSREDLF